MRRRSLPHFPVRSESVNTVVYTATDAHSLFLHDAHTRSSLAGIEHASVCTFELTYILACHCSDTAHALHDVEHETFSLQQRPYATCYIHGNVALLYLGTILNEYLNLQILVETCKDTLCHLNAGKHAIFLDEKHILSHCIGRDSRKGCMVAITNILGKGQIDKFVDKFVFYVHNKKYCRIIDCDDRGDFVVEDIMNKEVKTIMSSRSPFGFDFYTKVITFGENMFKADKENPFGSMLPMMMLMGDGRKSNDNR